MTPRQADAPPGLRYLWFWTFWHWSVESVRAGALARGPVAGVGSHWDEWIRHEASDADRQWIADAGRDARAQRRFLTWLVRQWAREATWQGRRVPARFVIGQLASLPPFDQWPTLDAYRRTYGSPGISAIVLAEGSAGEATDVCAVEAVALDGAEETDGPRLVAEGFRANAGDLEAVRHAAQSVFARLGLAVLLALWLAGGRRPYPRAVAISLGLGWCLVAGLVVWLLLGPDPGASVVALAAALVALWGALAGTALVVAAAVLVGAWRSGRTLGARLERSEIRLRMGCGLTVQGGSAGLPFCLDTMLAVYRADIAGGRRSWLWRNVLGALRREDGDVSAWVATGVVTADARVRPVVLLPKLRASLRHHDIRHILAPHQRDASARAVARVRDAEPVGVGARTVGGTGVRATLGFAAESPHLRSHPVRHVAQALMIVGGLASGWQRVVNALALATSAVVVAALPDLRSLAHGAPPPRVTGPASHSPYFLWVTLDTRHPNDFVVELESEFWANRRAPVSRMTGAVGSTRAELRLQRLHHSLGADVEDGVVWIARRRRFLGREFVPGERVGRYTFSYVAARR